jgi:hypothetical protein
MMKQLLGFPCQLLYKEGKKQDCVREQGDENIWTYNEVAGDWRKLHNEEPHNLYAPQSIIRMIKSRMLG